MRLVLHYIKKYSTIFVYLEIDIAFSEAVFSSYEDY